MNDTLKIIDERRSTRVYLDKKYLKKIKRLF